jgi:hypothetical protein
MILVIVREYEGILAYIVLIYINRNIENKNKVKN